MDNTDVRLAILESQRDENINFRRTIVSDLQRLQRQSVQIEKAIASLQSSVVTKLEIHDREITSLRATQKKMPMQLLGAVSAIIAVFTGIAKALGLVKFGSN